MKLSQATRTLIEETIKQSVARFSQQSDETTEVVTDIHLQPNASSGELALFDDDDNQLASAKIGEWTEYEGNNFYENAERTLSAVLNEMKEKGCFDNLSILKPYSFVLVDDEKETVAELLIMDDDTLMVNDELLKGLDDELNEFLKNLLEK